MKLKERNNVQGEEWNIVQGKTSSNENQTSENFTQRKK